MQLLAKWSLSGMPKGKGRARGTRGGHHFTPAATREVEQSIRVAAQQVWGERPPTDEPIHLAITAYATPAESWPAWKKAAALAGVIAVTSKPDFDNLAKTVDALNGVIWRDDAQVVFAVIRKLYAKRAYTEYAVFAKRGLFHNKALRRDIDAYTSEAAKKQS